VSLSCRLDTLHRQCDDLIEHVAKALDIDLERIANPRRSKAIDPHETLVRFLFDNLQFCDEVGRRTSPLSSTIVGCLRSAAVQQLPSEPEMDLRARKCPDHGMVSVAAASVNSARRPRVMPAEVSTIRATARLIALWA
jgi:hypothetical protein